MAEETLEQIAEQAILSVPEKTEEETKAPVETKTEEQEIPVVEEQQELPLEDDQSDGDETELEDEVLDSEDDEDPDEAYEDDEEDDESDPEVELYEVTVNDEVRQVSLEELKKSYSGVEFIDAKVQEASENAKESYETLQQVHEQSNLYLYKLHELARINQSLIGPEPEWDKLRAEDTAKYNQELARWNSFNQQQQELQKEAEQTQADILEQQKVALNKHAAVEFQKIIEHIPEVADQEKSKELYTSWFGRASKFGFTKDEFNGITDHRLLRVLHDYDRLATAEEARQQKIKDAKDGGKGKRRRRRVRTSVRPNASTAGSRKTVNEKRRDEEARIARQSGKPEDVAKTLIV
jgi:hypothetical protein